MAAPLDMAALSAAILAGHTLENPSAAALLPLLAVDDPSLGILEADGALQRLDDQDAKLPSVAEVARHVHAQSGGQQRGVLLVVQGDRLQASRRSRTVKRPRQEEPGSASMHCMHYPSKGPGNATTFHPPRDQQADVAPSMTVRRFGYPAIDASQRQRHESLAAQARQLPRGDARRAALQEEMQRLPGTMQASLPARLARWQVGEFQPLRALAEEEQNGAAITATAKDGSLLWLTLGGPLAVNPGRSMVKLCGMGAGVDGYRVVQKVERGMGRVAVNMAGPCPDPVAGSSIKIDHVIDASLVLYHFRLERSLPLQQPAPGAAAIARFQVAAAAAAGTQQQQQLQQVPVFPPDMQQLLGSIQAQQESGLGPLLLPAGPALQAPQPEPPAPLPQPAQPVEAQAAGAGGSGAGTGPDEEMHVLDDDASSDKHFRWLTLGQAQAVQAPAGVQLPLNPALDVRNEAILRQDTYVLNRLFVQGGQVLELSDQRLKTQVRALGGALRLVGRLNAVEFGWKHDPDGALTAGFLAQELHEAVHLGPDGTRFIAVTKLLPYAVGAIQELHKQQQVQDGEQQDLREQLERLQALLCAVLAGGFQMLVEGQEEQADHGRRLPPPRPPAAAAAQQATVAGHPAGALREVTEAAKKLFAGKMPASIAAWLAEKLGEGNPGILKQFRKWAVQPGPAIVAQAYLDATTKPRGEDAQGRVREPRGEFIRRMKGLLQQERQRERTAEAAAARGASPIVLREYQADILRLLGDGGNYCVVAPTGAGKTEIAVRHSAALLNSNPKAKIVFLAPTINLADQQAAQFRMSPPFNSLEGHRVECRCGGIGVPPREWPRLLEASAVVVVTPEIFRSALASGHATFDTVSLLILDECHGSYGDSPMARILRHYEHYKEWVASNPADVPATQIVGFTATPASKPTLGGTLDALQILGERLRARYVEVRDDHPELAAHVAQAQDQMIAIDPRKQDRIFAERLGRWALAALDLLGSALQGLAPGGGATLPTTLHLTSSELQRLALGLFSSGAQDWCVAAETFAAGAPDAEPAFKADIRTCCLLLSQALSVLLVVANLGCETAARRLAALVADVVQKLLGVPPEALLGQQEGSPVSSSSDSWAEDDASPGSSDNGSWGGAGPDLDGNAMQLLRKLSQDVLGQDTLAAAYSEGISGAPKSPKYAAMRDVLLRYRNVHNAHGIVFVRARADARELHRMIQAGAWRNEQLGFWQLHLIMGHAAGKGMSSVQQREAREGFGELGQRLLVATAAAEEGLNIPSCQFVVRFDAAQTGRERSQSKGRTRMPGSTFYELVERGTVEERLASKSAREVDNLKFAMAGVKSIRLSPSRSSPRRQSDTSSIGRAPA